MKAGIVAITVWLGMGAAAVLAGEAATTVTSTAASQAISRDKLLDINQAANDSSLLSLPKFDPRNIPLLVKIMSDPKEDEHARFDAASVLGLWRDPRAVDLLLGVINNPKMDGDARANAIVALGKIKYDSPAVVETLLKTLNDPDIGGISACALGKIGNPKALEPIVKLLQEGKSMEGDLVEALYLLGDKRAIPSLIAVLSNEKNDLELRQSAASALGFLRAKEAVTPLISLMRTDDPSLSSRYTAVIALGHIADVQAAETLVSLLNDLGGGSIYIDEEAARALWAIGLPATKALESGIRSKDPVIAEASARILDKIKNPEPTLQQRVDKCIADLDSKDETVRTDANDWLKSITLKEFENAAQWKLWWKQNRDTWKDSDRPCLPKIDNNLRIVSDPVDAIRKALPQGLVILKVLREDAIASDGRYVLPQPQLAIYVGLPLADNPIEKGNPWYQGVIRICPSAARAGDDEIRMALANVSNGYLIYHGSADLGKLLKDAVIRKRPQSATATASATASASAR